MNTELLYLILVTALTGLIWVPYIIDRLMVWELPIPSAILSIRNPRRLGRDG